jgi:DNA-directed RNA polymerase subunit L
LKPNQYKRQEGEELHVEANVVVDTAKRWAGFSPTALCTYEFVVDEELAQSALKKHVDDFQKQRADVSLPPATDEEVSEVVADFNALKRARQYGKDATGEPTSLLFSVDSECGLTPGQIVSAAFDVLTKQLKGVAEGKNEIDVTVRDGIAIALLRGASHTIGNILQSHMYSHAGLEYIGYCVPHPLENNARFKFSAAQDASPDELADFLKKQAGEALEKIRELADEWAGIMRSGTDAKAQAKVKAKIEPIVEAKVEPKKVVPVVKSEANATDDAEPVKPGRVTTKTEEDRLAKAAAKAKQVDEDTSEETPEDVSGSDTTEVFGSDDEDTAEGKPEGKL